MQKSRPDLLERISRAQAERAEAGLLRRLRCVESAEGASITISGRRLCNFASNDYLGLAGHPRVREAMLDGVRRWGVGAGAAHLLGGHRAPHEELEQALAAWTGRERALLYSTGYMANLGVAGALLGAGDVCVQDKLNHASLIDAARLSGASLSRYVHNDANSARRQLLAHPEAGALLASDGVFSMDGDVAPLAELATLCEQTGATMLVDDAHGIGVLGRDGAGSVAAAGLGQDQVPVLMATLGKAIGVCGAFVAGRHALIDGLLQFSRTYIYTTALPPALACATLAAVQMARHETWRRERLACLIAHLRHGALQRQLPLLPSTTPIQPLLVGASDRATQLSRALDERGYYVPAIRAPTVASGQARLRITLSVLHSEADVERLLDTLAELAAKQGRAASSRNAQPTARTRRRAKR